MNDVKKNLVGVRQEEIREFLISNKVLEYILGENFHPEVFKRSVPLIKFIYGEQGFSDE